MKLYLGEVRQIGIEVSNKLGQDFEIEAAEYEILDRYGHKVESGSPTIIEKQILTLFSAKEKGLFYLVFKYHIGPEILKAKITVEVV